MSIQKSLNLMESLAQQNGLSQPFIVGGVPRDNIIPGTHELIDVDITTGDEGVHQLAKLFASAVGKEASWQGGHYVVYHNDVRYDFSKHDPHPEINRLLKERGIENPSEMQKEAFSRDFTINTLMMPVGQEEVLDITGEGKEDIKEKIIRCPINCDISFAFDPKRMLRAYSFRTRYGFRFADDVKKSIQKNKHLLSGLDRRYASGMINKIVREEPAILNELIDDGILQYVPITKYINELLIKDKRLLDVMGPKTAGALPLRKNLDYGEGWQKKVDEYREEQLAEDNEGNSYKLKYTSFPKGVGGGQKHLNKLNQEIIEILQDYNVELWDVVDLRWSLSEAGDIQHRLKEIGVETEIVLDEDIVSELPPKQQAEMLEEQREIEETQAKFKAEIPHPTAEQQEEFWGQFWAAKRASKTKKKNSDRPDDHLLPGFPDLETEEYHDKPRNNEYWEEMGDSPAAKEFQEYAKILKSKRSLTILNKEARIRGPGVRECPFGLPIATACHNAGNSVDQMSPLVDTNQIKQARQRKSNRRTYVYNQTGERCKYADKIVENKDRVHCDWGEAGQGMSDFPLRPSPFYPRVFQGLGQYGLYSYPINEYTDNHGARQLFTGIFSLYASTGEVMINKRSFKPDPVLEKLAYDLVIKDE